MFLPLYISEYWQQGALYRWESFVHAPDGYDTHCAPGTVVGARCVVLGKTDSPPPASACSCEGDVTKTLSHSEEWQEETLKPEEQAREWGGHFDAGWMEKAPLEVGTDRAK